MSASTSLLETRASEALVFVALAAALSRPNDDILAIGAAPAWLEVACRIARVRPRTSERDFVFDAIGEHTRALVVVGPDEELLEALVELGPPVIALTRARAQPPRGAILLERTQTGARVALEASLAASLTRTLQALLGPGDGSPP